MGHVIVCVVDPRQWSWGGLRHHGGQVQAVQAGDRQVYGQHQQH